MPGLNSKDILRLLYEDLTPFVKDNRGILSVAADPWNFLELLAQTPNGWRLALHWAGDSNRQNDPRAGRIKQHELHFGISCQKGLTATPEEQLFKPRAGDTPALVDLVQMVEDRVAGYVFPERVSERYPLYRGTDPVSLPDGTPLSAYRIRFALTAVPAPVIRRAT